LDTKARGSLKEGAISADKVLEAAFEVVVVEIGSISGIRPVTLVKPVARESDLAGVFAVELRQQARDEDGVASRKAARGLEEEDAEDGGLAREEENAGTRGSKVNFFA
jgi:hypothetical protein